MSEDCRQNFEEIKSGLLFVFKCVRKISDCD